MRKIYLFVLMAFLSVSMNAEKVLMLVSKTGTMNNDKQIFEYLVDKGLDVDTVWIGETAGQTLSDYDVVFLSETPGSGDCDANFTAYDEIPVVCFKTYALRKSNITWLKPAADTDPALFEASSASSQLNSNVDAATVEANSEVEILVDHEIFTGIGAKGDVFSFASDNVAGKSDGHFQAFDLAGSPNADIAGATVELGASTKVADIADWTSGLTTTLALIEENSTSKNCVVIGYHSEWLLSDAGLTFMYNSTLWAAGTPIVSVNDIIASKRFSIYPNPMKNQLYINDAASINLVEVIDITGKVVASVANENASNLSINTSDLNAGIYMIRVNAVDGTYTDKLIK